MILKVPDYMAKSSKIKLANVLDKYFPTHPKSNLSTNIDFQLVRHNKINQVAIWPAKISEFQKYIKTQKITGDFLKPGVVCQFEKASLVRVEPLKWWVIRDKNQIFKSLSEDVATVLDLSHSFVQLEISGAYASQVLSHHVPVDMRDKNFAKNTLVTTSLHHVAVKLWRSYDCWHIFMPRSYSESLWQLIFETAEQYGYSP